MNDRRRYTDTHFRLHDKYEAMKKKLKAKLPHREGVQDSVVFRLFGATLLRPGLWRFDAESLARGLALGMFVAFTPTIGFQMLLVAILILFYPGNLPVALATCWLTNPATALPIYYVEYLLGEVLLSFVGYAPHAIASTEFSVEMFAQVAAPLWFGSIIVSLGLAFVSYWLIHGVLLLERDVKLHKILHLRRLRKEKNSPPIDKDDEKN
jgi:hypothetical protein